MLTNFQVLSILKLSTVSHIGMANQQLNPRDANQYFLLLDHEISIDIVPSSPKYIRNVEVSRCQKPVDEERRSDEMRTLYYGIKSLVKFDVLDEYGNSIQQIRDERCYAVTIEYPETNGSYPLEWKMRSGTIFATFLPRLVGERQMIVRLEDKRLNAVKETTCTYQIPINVLFPPCSPSLTLKHIDNNLQQSCTAGKEFTFQVRLYDVFGNAVLQDSDETCDIVVQVTSLKKAVERHRKEDEVTATKINSSDDLSFSATVCFEIAGIRKVSVIANSGSLSSSKDIFVTVLPSTPHHLNDVRFTTNGTIDESFSADPTVMYKEQWSTLGASLVDCYENVVQEVSNEYNISLKLSNDKGEEIEMEYKDAEIQNERFRLQAKINKAGEHNLLLNLTHRNFPDLMFHLKGTQIQVKDAPLYLAGSKFRYPDTGVAGEEIQIEILPIDVFGYPLDTASTIDYNLTADISDPILELKEIKETMDFRIVKQESKIVICVSVVLKKASRRKLIIFDRDNQSKKPSTHLHGKRN